MPVTGNGATRSLSIVAGSKLSALPADMEYVAEPTKPPLPMVGGYDHCDSLYVASNILRFGSRQHRNKHHDSQGFPLSNLHPIEAP